MRKKTKKFDLFNYRYDQDFGLKSLGDLKTFITIINTAEADER